MARGKPYQPVGAQNHSRNPIIHNFIDLRNSSFRGKVLLMKLIFIAITSILYCMLKLARPNGLVQLASEMIVLRTQLLTVRKKRKKAPPLTLGVRLTLAMAAHFIPERRLRRAAVVVSPATILKFHRYLVRRKYSKLFSNQKSKGGRPRISPDIRSLVIEIKTKNPMFGCPQIAAIVYDRTGISIDKETVRRILMQSYEPPRSGEGPSWLTFLGSQADSL